MVKHFDPARLARICCIAGEKLLEKLMDKLKVQLSASRPGTQTKRQLWVLCGLLQCKYQGIRNSLREECSQ